MANLNKMSNTDLKQREGLLIEAEAVAEFRDEAEAARRVGACAGRDFAPQEAGAGKAGKAEEAAQTIEAAAACPRRCP